MKRILIVSTADVDEPWLTGPAAQLATETGAEVTVLAVDDVESQRFEALPREEHLERARRTAQRLDADLIVVGSHPKHSMLKRLTGSLPFELVRRSGRQVLVVSGP